MQALYTWILVHMVNIWLDQTHLPSFDIVIVVLPMCLFISVSMVTLLEIVDPRYMKLCTTCSFCPEREIDGSSFAPCLSACVFFRLIMSPKHWQPVWNLLMRYHRSSEESDVMAASSVNRNLHRHFVWHFDFAFSLWEVEKAAIWSCLGIYALCGRPKSMLQQDHKEYARQCWGKYIALFHSTVYVKWLDVEPL